ncbi:murein biosynthesis integral membrane protein MurJ [Actinomadura alba]|uniref:Probable lipid II flippase MurJ n=2 Tax=Actinomadura alba TaxID=406431 RepID=A0ABR7LMU6_9ACTN|nr:murein biosynthesis integral membrane protein MurJ [Actinomadura alba]
MPEAEPSAGGVGGPQEEPKTAPAGRSSSLMRSGLVMAIGTIASRVTGFLRTAVIVAALGTGLLANAYNSANTIPNMLYDLLLGGILTSVIVPLIVRARERDAEYGRQFEQRLFTITVLFLGGLTLAATLLAPVLINLLGSGFKDEQRDLAILFAWFFLPQIFFYGVGAFAGAILNTRHRFGAPMWAPVLNNLVVIAIGIVFVLTTTGEIDPANITDAQINLLALGTTGGIVLQTIALWPSLRAAGFRWRPRLDFQRGELGEITRLAGWTLMYVISTQIGVMVTVNLLNSAAVRGHEEGIGDGFGYTPYFNAYQLFQLPYAIVAVSVITALLPRMSEHAADGNRRLVRDDFSSGLRLSSVIMLPAAALMFVLGPEIATVLFAHGNTSHADALVIAHVMQMLAIALVPFSTYQLMLRVFYAFRDTRTPAFISLITVSTNIAMAFAMYQLLPTRRIVIGVAAGFAVANIVGTIVCWAVLRSRLDGLDSRRIITGHLKLLIAAWPLIGFAFAVHKIVDAWIGTSGTISALAVLAVGTAGGGVLYLVFARLLRVGEVQTLLGTLAGRLGR